MSPNGSLNRRAFLRGAGGTALLGAVGARTAFAEELGRLDGLSPLSSSVLSPVGRQEFDFDEIYERRGSSCIKWDRAIEQYGPGIEVGMGIADQDFRAAPCVTKALAERFGHENWGYLHRGSDFNDDVVEWNRRRYGLDIDPDGLVWTNGVHTALIAALHTFAPPGSRVLMNTPTYNGFYTDLRFTRTVPEDSPMTVVDGKYSLDWDDFELRAQRSSAFILCNPQNPTGNCWSEEDLLRMGEICLRHRVPVLADEIHCDFVNRGQTYTPFASLPDRDIVANSLTFKSSSKSFNLASMKVAWYFSTNPDYLERVQANSRSTVPTLGMFANRAALREGEPWLDELLVYVDGNHDFAEAYIRDRLPLVDYTKAEGTFLAWLDVGGLIDRLGAEKTAAAESESSVDAVTATKVVQRWLAENAGVFLNPGSDYGTGGERHMRMNLATSRKLIEHALRNIEEALAAL